MFTTVESVLFGTNFLFIDNTVDIFAQLDENGIDFENFGRDHESDTSSM